MDTIGILSHTRPLFRPRLSVQPFLDLGQFLFPVVADAPRRELAEQQIERFDEMP